MFVTVWCEPPKYWYKFHRVEFPRKCQKICSETLTQNKLLNLHTKYQQDAHFVCFVACSANDETKFCYISSDSIPFL